MNFLPESTFKRVFIRRYFNCLRDVILIKWRVPTYGFAQFKPEKSDRQNCLMTADLPEICRIS